MRNRQRQEEHKVEASLSYSLKSQWDVSAGRNTCLTIPMTWIWFQDSMVEGENWCPLASTSKSSYSCDHTHIQHYTYHITILNTFNMQHRANIHKNIRVLVFTHIFLHILKCYIKQWKTLLQCRTDWGTGKQRVLSFCILNIYGVYECIGKIYT